MVEGEGGLGGTTMGAVHRDGGGKVDELESDSKEALKAWNSACRATISALRASIATSRLSPMG